MTNIAPVPFTIGNCKLTIEDDDYEASVSAAELVPTVPSASFKGLTPAAVYNLSGVPTWVLNLTLAQDWATAESLSNMLLANQGQTKDIVLTPLAGGPGFAVTAILVPTNIGGAGDATAVSQVSLPVNGQPIKQAA
jgi:hypothetical protein